MAVYSENAGYNPNIGDAPHWQAEPSNIRRVRLDFAAIIAARAATAVDGAALPALTDGDQLVVFKCKEGTVVRSAGVNVITAETGKTLTIGEDLGADDIDRFGAGLSIATTGQKSSIIDAAAATEGATERSFQFSADGNIIVAWNSVPTTAVVDVWADIVDTVPDTSVPSELPNRNYVNPT
ncbi:MAG: hypothetical protein K0U66_04825 [Gammaproteobacteria bacterium]|nr:hypothetical protein [Gammaproteobacteria bacterium]